MVNQAIADALATARIRLRDEIAAIAKLEARIDGQDLRFAQSEANHYRALIARLEAKQ